MAEWWSSLGITGQVFACVAIPSTLLLVIQTVMLFFGFVGQMEVCTLQMGCLRFLLSLYLHHCILFWQD